MKPKRRVDIIINPQKAFGGQLNLPPPTVDYGRVRNPEEGKIKREIEVLEEKRGLNDESKEVWE